MNIALTAYGIVQITLTTEEAEAVRDDLGGIPANKVSTHGDKLHSLLETVTSGPVCGDEYDGEECELEPGHAGGHIAGNLAWSYSRTTATA